MKKIYLWTISSAFALNACAQQNPTIIKYAKLITADDAKKHLSIIASDDFEGRETGKPGAEKAANYIAAEFKRLGLQAPVNGSYFLDVPLTQNLLQVTDFTVNGKAFSYGKDFYLTGTYPDKNLTFRIIMHIFPSFRSINTLPPNRMYSIYRVKYITCRH